MVSLVNYHGNATGIGWHLWEIDLRFAPGLPPGWVGTCCGDGFVEICPQLRRPRPPHLLFLHLVQPVPLVFASACRPASPRSSKSCQAQWAAHRGRLLDRRGCMLLEYWEREELPNLREQRLRREQRRRYARILPIATREAAKEQTSPRQVVHCSHEAVAGSLDDWSRGVCPRSTGRISATSPLPSRSARLDA